MESDKVLSQLICSLNPQDKKTIVRLMAKNGSIDDVVFNQIIDILKKLCENIAIVDVLNELFLQETAEFTDVLKQIVATENPLLLTKLNTVSSVEDIIHIEPHVIREKFLLLEQKDIQCLLKGISPSLHDYLLNTCKISVDDNAVQKTVSIAEVENAIGTVLKIFNTPS